LRNVSFEVEFSKGPTFKHHCGSEGYLTLGTSQILDDDLAESFHQGRILDQQGLAQTVSQFVLRQIPLANG
jgi:hypothetical protein